VIAEDDVVAHAADATAAQSGFSLRQVFDWRSLARTPYGAGPIALMSVIALFQSIDSFAFTFALPEIIRTFHITFTSIASIVSMVGFFGAIGGLYLGYLADRIRRLPMYLIGTILSGLSSMATAAAHSTLTLGTPRVIDTGAEVAVGAPQFSLIADYYPPDSRGRVFGLMGMAQNLGNVAAPIVAATVITALGLRVTFVILGAPITILGIVGLIVLREPVRGFFERKELGATDDVAKREDDAVSFGEAWRTVWSIRTARRMFIGGAIITMGFLPFFTLYQVFLSQVYGLSTAARGAVSSIFILGALAGTFIGAGAIDVITKYRPARALTLFGLFASVASLGMLVVGFTPPLWVVVAGITFFFFGVSLTGPAQQAVMSQVIPPQVRGIGLQVLGLAVLPAVVFATPVFSQLVTHDGWGTAIFCSVPLLVVGAVVIGSAGAFFDLDRRSALAASLAAEEWREAKTSGMGKLLVCRDVTVHYDNVQVLFGVDFDVEEGEIIALLGTNGAGKSTLLRAITGVHEASGGAVVFDGRDITHMPPHEVARRGVVLMPGGRGVFPGLTVADNLLVGSALIGGHGDDHGLDEVFELFPVLKERQATLAGALSGGEQQQLSLAQAFLANPRLLAIDELSLGLSPIVVAELIDKVKELHKRGTTIVIVEQSVNVALAIADRAVFMEKGEVKFFGATSDLRRRPDILRAVYVRGAGGATGGGSAGRARRSRRSAAGVDAASAKSSALEVAGLVKDYGGIRALDGVSFAVPQGMLLGVLGPNGSGKTTLFDIISGFQRADEGTVRYDGIDITGLTAQDRARQGLIRRFQDARLFPSLTVFETLELALDQQLAVKSVVLNAAALSSSRKSERRLGRRADELIELLGLGAYRDKFVKELSTGLRRVVDLACTIAREPRVLLLDEPSSGIAQAEAEGLAPLLARIRHETGTTMLVIEHDVALLSRIADELMVLVGGRVLVRGQADVVLDDERVIEAYLGVSETATQRSGEIT